MAVVQSTYGNMSDSVQSTRPRVEREGDTDSGGGLKITFDDHPRVPEVAAEIARLLGVSPEEFGYGDKAAKPIEIVLEKAIIECAITLAHLRLREYLPLKGKEDL